MLGHGSCPTIIYGSHGPAMEYLAMRSAKLRDSLYEVFEA